MEPQVITFNVSSIRLAVVINDVEAAAAASGRSRVVGISIHRSCGTFFVGVAILGAAVSTSGRRERAFGSVAIFGVVRYAFRRG